MHGHLESSIMMSTPLRRGRHQPTVTGCCSQAVLVLAYQNGAVETLGQHTTANWRQALGAVRSINLSQGGRRTFSIVLARRLARWSEHTGPSSWLGQDGASQDPKSQDSRTSPGRERVVQGHPGHAHRPSFDPLHHTLGNGSKVITSSPV
jgi:hypothetical protein